MPIDPAKPFDLHYTVDPNWIDMRFDQYIKAMVPSMSRTKIQKYIKAKRALVNDEPRPSNWRVRLDDRVVLCCNVPEGGEDAGKHIPLDFLYEDDDLAIINKQPNLVVHPVALHRHDTLLNALYWRYKDILPEDQDVSLANRLDQYTSGVILVSKHTESKRILQDQFEAREPKKTYVAILEGTVEQVSGEINLAIGPGIAEKDKCKMCVRDDGKPSLTHYEVIKHFSHEEHKFTFIRLKPHTGRQHQLRVHCAAIGHPIICDDRYGRPEPVVINVGGKEVTMSRYALHAEELTFKHPMTGEMMTTRAPIADDMKIFIEALERS